MLTFILLFYAEIGRGKALLETMSSEGINSMFYNDNIR